MEDDALSEELQREQRILLKKEKEERIKKEVNRLKRLYKNMPKNTMDKVSSLIKNAAFMTITLEDLQETINIDGAVTEYKNGENQFGTKKSPEVEIYNTMIKNHMGIIKQLTDLMPEPVIPEKTEEEKKKDEFNRILRREGNEQKNN